MVASSVHEARPPLGYGTGPPCLARGWSRGCGAGGPPSQPTAARGRADPATTVNHLKAWLGIGLTVAVVVAAVAAPWLAPRDPLSTDFAPSLRPPGTPGHPPRTDQLGPDLPARLPPRPRLALFIRVFTVP